MTPRRLCLALLALLLVAEPAAAGQRRQSVGDWRVEEVDAGNGGRVVRMRRVGRGYALDYRVEIWRRNAAQLRGATLRWRDCRSGDADALQDPDAELSAETVREQIGHYLAECRIPSAEADAILTGYEPAFALLSAWVEQAAALLVAGPDPRDATMGVPSDDGRGLRDCTGLRAIYRTATGALLDLRQAPDWQSAVVGRMPDANSFVVRATFDGWVEVELPADEAAPPGTPPLTGWLLGHGVSLLSDAAIARAFPRASSQAILRSRDGAPLADHGAIEDVIACDGGWVFGRWRIDKPARVEHVRAFEVGSAPLRVEAWVPAIRDTMPARADLRRDVAGWRVESISEEESGRLVRLSRIEDDYAVEYYATFWHGNAGPYYGASVTRPGLPCGDDSWRRDPDGLVWAPEADVPAAARDLRGRLAGLFEGCGATPAEIEAALAGLGAAYALAAEWAEEDRRLVLAVSQAIASYGAIDEQ